MRVALDMTPAVSGVNGVARHGEILLEGLQRQSDVEVIPFSVGRAVTASPRWRHLGVPLRLLHPAWRTVGFPTVERICGARVDLVHSMDLIPPPSPAPLVISLQDLIPRTRPEFYSSRARAVFESKLREVRRARVVLIFTNVGADETAAVLDLDRSRFHVAPLCAHLDLSGDEPSPVDGPYILSVGSVTPRKGFDVVAAAHAQLGPSAPRLVIVGPVGFEGEQIASQLAQRSGVVLTGEVSDGTLAALYRGANVVCQGSRAEGFGLVPLEGMAAGVPVVATDLPEVREVVGNRAALLVPVDDPDSMAAALQGALTDSTLRAGLIRAGTERLHRFSPDATAAAVAAGYRRALEG